MSWLDPDAIERNLSRVVRVGSRAEADQADAVDGAPAETRPGASEANSSRKAVLTRDLSGLSRSAWQDVTGRHLYHEAPLDRLASFIGSGVAEGPAGESSHEVADPAGGLGAHGKRVAVYTAIIDDYDPIHVPQVMLPGVDFIVFANTPVRIPSNYKIRSPEYHSFDPVRTARYVKTHPHVLLRGYDYAIWIDANVVVTADISDIICDQIASRCPIGAVQHVERRSVYQEAVACLFYSKDESALIRAQVERYDRLGFDCDDLIESNFMIFDLRYPRIGDFFASWWREIDRYSRRDQLSLNYAIGSVGAAWRPLMEKPYTLKSHPKFLVLPHGAEGRALSERRLDIVGARRVDPAAEGARFISVKDERMSGQSDRSVDIVVCVKDAYDDVRRCLESLFRVKACSRRQVILIDDGSAAETREYLKVLAASRDDIVLHRNDTPLGYTRAANQGLALSSADLVILLNSDTIVTDWWAEKMADAVFRTPGAGIVGPLSNAASYQSIPHIGGSGGQTAINALPDGKDAEDMNRLCEESSPAEFPRVPLVHGFCFGVTRELIKSIGYFDEHHFPNGYGEENDYCFRAVDAGFDCVIATSTYVFHAKTKSYGPERRKALAEKGGAMFRRLHGDDRVKRAIESMRSNPVLAQMRKAAEPGRDADGRSGAGTPSLLQPRDEPQHA